MCISTIVHTTWIAIATHYNCTLTCRIVHTRVHMEDFVPVTLATDTSDWKLPNFGADKPNQPLQFDFPKHEFGKTRIVNRVFQSQWIGSGNGYIMTAPGIWFSVILLLPLSRGGN